MNTLENMETTLTAKKTFPHGVHPPEAKEETHHLKIRRFPFAPVMILPLSQHTGKPSKAMVREGQEVARGQKIAEADGFVSVALHAPASGIIKRIALAPNPVGRMTPSIYLQPFPASSQEVLEGTPIDPDRIPRRPMRSSRRSRTPASWDWAGRLSPPT